MSQWRISEPGIVEFPGGRRIRGVSLRNPRNGQPEADFGLYLLGRDPRLEGRVYRWVRWRDFSLPYSNDDAVDALREAYSRATSERVEIGCAGGIGRTGTALSVIAIMSGVPADDAVSWVRDRYQRKAVETRAQRRWIESTAATIASKPR